MSSGKRSTDRSPGLKSSQIRAARALLDWSQEEIAGKSGLSIATIRKLELGHISPRGKTTGSIRRAFEAAGLEFIEPDGVRHRPEGIIVYQGRSGYVDFFDDVYDYAASEGGEIIIVVASESPFFKIRGRDTSHTERMFALRNQVSVKCIVTEDKEDLNGASYCEYRWLSKSVFESVPFYVYGDRYAIFLFEADPSPKIMVLQSPLIAEAFRRQFYSMWERAIPLNEVERREERALR